jgi:hypothetical protein
MDAAVSRCPYCEVLPARSSEADFRTHHQKPVDPVDDQSLKFPVCVSLSLFLAAIKSRVGALPPSGGAYQRLSQSLSPGPLSQALEGIPDDVLD